MIKTILTAHLTGHNHPAVGPLYKVTFTDYTSCLVYAETFFDQVEGWRPGVSLEGAAFDLDSAFLYEA